MAKTEKILVAFWLSEALRDVLGGITAYAKQQGRSWQLLCVDANDLEPNLAHHRADGAIVTIHARRTELIRRLQHLRTPVVNMLHDLHPRLPSVLSDDRAIGRVGAEYLLARGFRHLAFLGVNTPWSQMRQAGFVEAANAAHVAPVLDVKSLAVTDFQFVSKVGGMATLRRWVRSLPPQTALMAASDFAGRTMVEAAIAEGVRVPQDLAVLGVDNFHMICELSPVPLSSVAQDFGQMGFEAAALLHRLMNKEAKAKRIRILVPPGRLQVRSSTDVLAFEDSSVLAAIRIIHDHAAVGISMKQLMRQVPLSRRWLDERFRKLVGRTVSEEIRHCRLKHVQDLLEQTDMPLRQIAARCQFSCTENFIRWFRAGMGLPPHAYRMSLQPAGGRRKL